MDSEQVLVEIQIDRIIQQMRTLSDEAIAILYDDGLLCSEYIDELAFRVQEHCTRESRNLKKILLHKILGKLKHPAKRPKKLDLSWISHSFNPKKAKTNHPHTTE